MTYISYILKICLYFLIIFVMYYLALRNRRLVIKVGKQSLGGVDNDTWRLSFIAILIITILFAYYSIICGATPETIDRARYAHRFEHNIYEERKNSEALFWVEYFLSYYTKDPRMLFFSVTGMSVLLTLLAYNLYKEAKPITLVYLGFTQYFFYTFYQLKQAPAIALIAISFWCFLHKKRVFCILTLLLAILFHEVAYIAVPIYILLLGSKKKWVWITEIIIFGVATVAFSFVTKSVVNIVNLVPGLGIQIARYVSEDGSINVYTHFATAIKGIPLYLLSFYGISKRKELVGSIENYDKYLILTVFSSFTVVLSIYNYWMWRLGTIFLFPICTFATEIKDNLASKKEGSTFHFCFLLSYAFFTIRVIFQYYFKYGGF